jgi:molybdenum cofactor sulfurtransferase
MSRVDDIRLRVLRFFNADPDVYDLVFVANATAGIKLVGDALRDYQDDQGRSGFRYRYHIDSHTSLIGVRELAGLGSRCFESDDEVERWLSGSDPDDRPMLFAYPAQSNMNGHRLPLPWCRRIRQLHRKNVFTLLDAAGLVSTAPLDLGDPEICPDFLVLSFYKIFGFPDLGALIVRKDASHVFQHRRYFGGGTVDMVIVRGAQWHAKKDATVHDRLEDGTLPFHNIIALDSALRVHERLYGSMSNISAHTGLLAQSSFEKLSALKHANGSPVCHFYTSPDNSYANRTKQGPIIAFNLRDTSGKWVGKSEVEKLASVKKIHIRSGTLCNPGGAASQLGLRHDEMLQNFQAGQRCGDEHDVMYGKPTGLLRVSFGAMSSWGDVTSLVSFVREFYVQTAPVVTPLPLPPPNRSRFYVENISVYPIKSCAGFKVPPATAWQINSEGLAWDREWCIIHEGTGVALSQKRYPRMALIRPYLDLENGFLRVTCGSNDNRRLDISMARDDPRLISSEMCPNSTQKSSNVCGDRVTVQVYSSPEVSAFFSDFLGIPCNLARLPPQTSTRYSKARAVKRSTTQDPSMPGSFPEVPGKAEIPPQNPILLSNESPILLISRSSVNRLNESIKLNSRTGTGISRAVAADVFRANIVIAEDLSSSQPLASASIADRESSSAIFEQPYIEDTWTSLRIGPRELPLDVLGSCQRCQMVCVNQLTAERCEEPFSTLAKVRRIGGKVCFGRHLGLPSSVDDRGGQYICIGDAVVASYN